MAATREQIRKAENLEQLQALAKKHGYSDKWIESVHKSREKFKN